jgi:hypothetical protein
MWVDARVIELSVPADVLLLLLALDPSFHSWVLALPSTLVGVCLLCAAYITLRPSYDPTFGLLQRVRSPRSTGVYALYVGLSVLVLETVVLLLSNRLPLSGVKVGLLSLIGAGMILLVMTLPLQNGER